MLAEDYRLHFDSAPEMDRSAAAGFLGAFIAAFPNIHHSIEDQIAEGDQVASRIVVRGTHKGELMGIPPTGKDIEFNAINIHRIVNGRVAEQWIVSDGLGMMQQLGVIPTPGAAAPGE
jgi:predicted ester cyclase